MRGRLWRAWADLVRVVHWASERGDGERDKENDGSEFKTEHCGGLNIGRGRGGGDGIYRVSRRKAEEEREMVYNRDGC